MNGLSSAVAVVVVVPAASFAVAVVLSAIDDVVTVVGLSNVDMNEKDAGAIWNFGVLEEDLDFPPSVSLSSSSCSASIGG